MASRTYNRRPNQVNLPSDNATKNYFFDHCNWKGVNKNKNFLAVDQETFSDANNVYVDGEGILRSRPAVKLYDYYLFADINVIGFKHTDKADVVYYSKNGENGENDTHWLRIIYDYETYKDFQTTKDRPLVVPANNGLYIFDETFKYFNMETGEFENGEFDLYSPTTKIYASKISEGESKNILMTGSTIVYHYDNAAGMPAGADGKELSASISGNSVTLRWDSNSPDLIVTQKGTITNYENKSITVSSKGDYCFYDYDTGELRFSKGGQVFKVIDTVKADVHGEVTAGPKFSGDGNYVTLCTVAKNEKGKTTAWIISVYADQSSGNLRFAALTDMLTEEYAKLIGVTYEFAGTSMDVAIDLISWDHFAFALERNDDVTVHTVKNSQYRTTGIDRKYGKKLSQLRYSGIDALLVIAESTGYTGGAVYVYNGAELWRPLPEPVGDSAITFDTDFYNVDCQWRSDGFSIVFGDPLVEKQDRYLHFFSFIYENGDFIMDNDVHFKKDFDSPVFLSSDGMSVLTSNGVYHISKTAYEQRNLLIGENVMPIGYTDKVSYLVIDGDDGDLYDGKGEIAIDFEYRLDGHYVPLDVSHVASSSNLYFANGDTLYVSASKIDSDGRFKWYFPDGNKHLFDFEITGLHPISTKEIAVFGDDQIWYLSETEDGIQVVKSRIDVGLKQGSGVLNGYEGTQTLLPCSRGFVSLGYQNFVASTEQELTVLSDPIYDDMSAFVKNPIKLFKHDHWVLLYRKNNGYIFDTRNNSWWPVSCEKDIDFVFSYKSLLGEQIVLLSNGKTYTLSKDGDYLDVDNTKIDWHFTSQKLHFGQPNYYKHIVNLTLMSLSDDENAEITHDLDIVNYRNTFDQVSTKNIAYKVENIRTYVQRLNHFKVNEFQYSLSADFDNSVQLPLSLSNITTKYKITGQVR